MKIYGVNSYGRVSKYLSGRSRTFKKRGRVYQMNELFVQTLFIT